MGPVPASAEPEPEPETETAAATRDPDADPVCDIVDVGLSPVIQRQITLYVDELSGRRANGREEWHLSLDDVDPGLVITCPCIRELFAARVKEIVTTLTTDPFRLVDELCCLHEKLTLVILSRRNKVEGLAQRNKRRSGSGYARITSGKCRKPGCVRGCTECLRLPDWWRRMQPLIWDLDSKTDAEPEPEPPKTDMEVDAATIPPVPPLIRTRSRGALVEAEAADAEVQPDPVDAVATQGVRSSTPTPVPTAVPFPKTRSFALKADVHTGRYGPHAADVGSDDENRESCTFAPPLPPLYFVPGVAHMVMHGGGGGGGPVLCPPPPPPHHFLHPYPLPHPHYPHHPFYHHPLRFSPGPVPIRSVGPLSPIHPRLEVHGPL